MTEHKRYGKRARGLYRLLIVICALAVILAILAIFFLSDNQTDESSGQADNPEYIAVPEEKYNTNKNGIHVGTGLIEADGLTEVVTHCTPCHSAKLLTQNRLNEEGWKATIRWMQETQNLWDLGENEEVIINYLVTNYPIENKGRREPLPEAEWYWLKK